ncbi:MAG: PAS domain-containing protein [Candidatus Shapirobacteria bacterium]|jgi:PAS domain S-box-containing protein
MSGPTGLSSSPKLFRQIIDDLPIPLFVKNAKLQYLFSSKSFHHNLLGLSSSQALASQNDVFLSALKPKFRLQFLSLQRQLLASPGNTSIDVGLDLPGGSSFYRLHLTSITSGISGGGLIGYLIRLNDSSSFPAKSEESGDLIQRIVDLLPVGVFWKDHNFKYLGCNQVFAQDANQSSASAVIGKTDFEIYSEDRAKKYREDDQNVFVQGKSKINQEEKRTLPSKKDHWIRLSKIPLTDPAGQIIGVVGVYDDITDIKKAESELTDKLAQLEKINRFMVGRELKMIELKNRIRQLEEQLKQ